MNSKTLTTVLVFAALTTLSQAVVINVTPVDITFASVSTTANDPGTIVRGNSDQFEVRSRTQAQVLGGDNRTVSTFANFDISSIPAGSIINSAILSATYDSQLNNLNDSGPASVGAVTQAWNPSGSLNPLFTYGEDHTLSGLDASNSEVLVADIDGTAATGQTQTADLTSIFQGWYDGSLDNNGLVFYIDGFGAQGAGSEMDASVAAYSSGVAAVNPVAAMESARVITNVALQEKVMVRIVRQWRDRQPQKMQDYLEQSEGLPGRVIEIGKAE
ncbi:MAG: DNRLRE domain-containing protein [Akkermansiaceae bacterium]